MKQSRIPPHVRVSFEAAAQAHEGLRHRVTHEVAAPVVQFVPSPQILVTTQGGNQLAELIG